MVLIAGKTILKDPQTAALNYGRISVLMCKILFLLFIIEFIALGAAPAKAVLPESLDCSAVEGFYYDALLMRHNDADAFIANSERYGISSSPWELTQHDLNAFQARLLQCKTQGRLTRAFRDDMLGGAMSNFKELIVESAKRDVFLSNKLQSFESALVALEIDVSDSGYTLDGLFERYAELNALAKTALSASGTRHQAEADDLRHRLETLGRELLSRLDRELDVEIRP
jgi:hypothetical protein